MLFELQNIQLASFEISLRHIRVDLLQTNEQFKSGQTSELTRLGDMIQVRHSEKNAGIVSALVTFVIYASCARTRLLVFNYKTIASHILFFTLLHQMQLSCKPMSEVKV